MFRFLNLFDKKRKDNKNIHVNFHIDIPESVLLSIGDSVSPNMPVPPANYMGKFLRKEHDIKEHDIIVIGVCVPKNKELLYKEDSIIGVSFVNHDTSHNRTEGAYNFSAKILNINRVDPRDSFILQNMNSILETRDKNQYELFIFELKAISSLTPNTRRKFYRINLSTPIYYKPDSNYNEADKKDKGDMSKGYIKLETINVSEGGVKCSSMRYIEPGRILDCYMLMGYEALPISLRVLETSLAHQSDHNKKDDDKNKSSDMFFIRAIFFELNDDIRDRLTMQILQFQQKEQRFRKKIKKMKDLHEFI